MKKYILVVDDEKLIRWSLQTKLTSWGYDVETADDAKNTYASLEKRLPDLVLLDIKLPDGNGMDILKRIHDVSDDVAVIMITAEGTVETAVEAMKLGAYDYLVKPFNLDKMQVLIERALEKSEMKRHLDVYRADGRADMIRDQIIGESPRLNEVLNLVKKVAQSPSATVMLTGESGTGKNLFARAIHNESDRSENPFVTIESTTIPENLLESELFGHEKGAFTDARTIKKGLFELAKGGTVFFDEVGELPVTMQTKLLRLIDEKRFKRVGGVIDFEIDVRVVAATNMDLELAVEEKQFRRDLYFRLNVVPICLPPLRDRDKDIILLAEFFMNYFNRQFGKEFNAISPDARTLLLEYYWPGNVRELRNVIERAILLESGTEIKKEHLILQSKLRPAPPPAEKSESINSGLTMDEMETEMIRKALLEAGGNQTRAAKLLGISRDVLRYRMRKYQISL
jgi:DNA-binding NtrC family response regulator